MLWETFQTLFMLGTLVTVMVNIASIKALTRRIFRVENTVWPVHDQRSNYD